MFTIKLTPLLLFSIIIFTLIIAVMFGNKLSLAEPFGNSPEGEGSPSIAESSPTNAAVNSTTGETLIAKFSEDKGVYKLANGTIVQKKINLSKTPSGLSSASVPGTESGLGSESGLGTEINIPSASRNGYTSRNGIEITYRPPT